MANGGKAGQGLTSGKVGKVVIWWDPAEVRREGDTFYRIDDGRRICGAGKRGSRQVCMKVVGLAPNGRCTLHGGHAHKGVEHPSFKHGLLSKYFPLGHIKRAFDESFGDASLKTMDTTASVLFSRKADILTQLADVDAKLDSLPMPEAIAALLGELNSDSPDIGRLKERARGISDAWRGVHRHEYLMGQLTQVADLTRKMAEGHAKITRTVSPESLAIFLYSVAEIVKAHVTDLDVRRKLVDQFRLMAPGGVVTDRDHVIETRNLGREYPAGARS